MCVFVCKREAGRGRERERERESERGVRGGAWFGGEREEERKRAG